MQEIFFLIEEDDEGGFNARALEVPIFTQADSIEELRQNIKEAVACHFEDEKSRYLSALIPNFLSPILTSNP